MKVIWCTVEKLKAARTVCTVSLWYAVTQLLAACCQSLILCVCLPVLSFLRSLLYQKGTCRFPGCSSPKLGWCKAKCV